MIIDFHTHAFNPKVAERAIAKLEVISGLTAYTRGLVVELTDRMDEWGVDKSVMFSIATKPSQQKVVNDWAAKINDENERILAFGSVHPEAEDVFDEIERIAEMGLYGIKLHPDYQEFMVDDERLDPVYDHIAKVGIPVAFHTGWDCLSPELIHCPPERSLKMLKKHPDMKVILAHLGGNDMWEDVFELLAGINNEVYFDTSFTAKCPDELMTRIINKHGADRILLGSDCPWESAQKMIEKLLRLDISDDAREKIMGKNACRLLGLDENIM